MYRTHSCGALTASDINTEVTLAGWVQKSRDKGFMIWIDLRDRYGLTQLIFDEERTAANLMGIAKSLGREFVIQVTGTVIERQSKNPNMKTGAIEVLVTELTILNAAKTPPFTIEDKTDGGEDVRMKYRYLDIRRNPVKENLLFRHKVSMEVRKYLSDEGFVDVETPYLIKSTPEGARDFLVPSRMHPGEFYALPQSPQTFKQLLMVAGYDRYFQIVRCFRDEDLRADRQPEFTQIDCEMTFVDREDILTNFESLVKHLFKELKGVELPKFPRMTYADAIEFYGSDKPDTRFEMKFNALNNLAQNKGFKVFDDAEWVGGICATGAAGYSRKDLDKLTEWVKRPQIGARGLVYIKYNEDGSFKSSIDKFFNQNQLSEWATLLNANPGDLILVLSGDKAKTQTQLSQLRLEMGSRLGLRDSQSYSPLWVVDFPLLEFDEESGRHHAMHHPFTSPLKEDEHKMETAPGEVRANAYDMVVNGVELGGGSIRIFDKTLQSKMFDLLGFTKEEAEAQFGFLMNAFEYGAPPHGGIAFGFDRICAMFGGTDSIRDYIAFPKNNSGRDVMIQSPSPIAEGQLKELGLKIESKKI